MEEAGLVADFQGDEGVDDTHTSKGVTPLIELEVSVLYSNPIIGLPRDSYLFSSNITASPVIVNIW